MDSAVSYTHLDVYKRQGKELPGAHLKVTDEDGNVIEEWVSTEKAHVIKELTVGKSYTMTETKPADGYVTAAVSYTHLGSLWDQMLSDGMYIALYAEHLLKKAHIAIQK